MTNKPILAAVLALCALTGAAGAAIAAPSLFTLGSLPKGQWELRDKEHDFRSVAKLCLGNPNMLAKPRHARKDCAVQRLNGDDRSAVFNYRCQGAYGTTTVRRETDTLVQIRSQGVDRGAPFALDYEARRTGSC